jgi:hypothetical protein
LEPAFPEFASHPAQLPDIPRHLNRLLKVGAVEEITSVQQNIAVTHRDAVRFSNGQEILLQQLQCGQRVEALNLGGTDEEINPQRTTQMDSRLWVG